MTDDTQSYDTETDDTQTSTSELPAKTSAPDAEAADPQSRPAAAAHPRIRIGAVVWGLLVIAGAALALWLQSSPTRASAALDAAQDAGPLGIGVGALVVTGGAIVLIAGTSLVRRAQIRRGGSD